MSQSAHRIRYIIAVILYGTNGLVSRFIDAPSEFVVLCRGVIGALTILLIDLLEKKTIDRSAIRKNLPILLLSGVGLGLNWIFLFAAYRATTVAIASLCNYMAPMMVLVILAVVNREALRGRKLVCVLAAFAGIVLVSGVLGEQGSSFNARGILLGMAAALGFVVIVLCNRRLSGMDPIDKSVVQLAISALVVLPFVLLRVKGSDLPADPVSIALLLFIGAVNTGVAYIFYFGAMSELPVESVAILGYIEPVVSVLTSAVILREKITVLGIAGAILILGAAAFNELGAARTETMNADRHKAAEQ